MIQHYNSMLLSAKGADIVQVRKLSTAKGPVFLCTGRVRYAAELSKILQLVEAYTYTKKGKGKELGLHAHFCRCMC